MAMNFPKWIRFVSIIIATVAATAGCTKQAETPEADPCAIERSVFEKMSKTDQAEFCKKCPLCPRGLYFKKENERPRQQW